MSDTFIKAKQHLDRGELSTAAVLFASDGFDNLNESNFESNKTFRMGIAGLIEAIRLDVQVGNDQRALAIRDITSAAIERVLIGEQIEDAILEGLYHEWIGDAHLLTGSQTANEYYETAAETYTDNSVDHFLSWGMEEEFDYIYWSVADHLEKECSCKKIPELEFKKRVEIKQDMP
jgi:hypothetical protein